MKIIFLVKFYHPFDRGGSEWSARDLACLLVKKGHLVTVVTPNYGAARLETIDGVNIFRMPFPIKLKNHKGQIAPFWLSNTIWFIASAIFCLFVALAKKADIIHIHNNEFLPAGVIAASIIKKPSVVTFRDYQALCPLGFCLWQSKRTCNLNEYIAGDFKFFWENYVSGKNSIKYLILALAALRARVTQKILYLFAKKTNFKIAVSQKVAEIFKDNGLRNLKVINNAVLVSLKTISKDSKQIIYAGKLSKGKGVDLLFETLPKVFSKIPDASLKVIGSGHLLPILKGTAKSQKLSSKVSFLGHLSHDEVLKEIRKSALTVVPSVWPEPLPRTIIEAILLAVPVVATNVGGNQEIVKKGYGIICQPNPRALQGAICLGLAKREIYKKNIMKDLKRLKNHFSNEAVRNHEKIYEQLIHRFNTPRHSGERSHVWRGVATPESS